jgi:3-isopropylmalate/(R)-2-methylmalate dehydratase small subunit
VIISGRAVVVPGDDVNTDLLYPGPYLNIDDPQDMKNYLFEGLDPSLRSLLGTDTVLVVGANFGGGSSREHVQLAMKAWNVRAVLGCSFARIFFRNCINLGLPAVVSAEAVAAARAGSALMIDAECGRVEVDETAFDAPALPEFVIDIFRCDGLEGWVRRRLAAGGPGGAGSGGA